MTVDKRLRRERIIKLTAVLAILLSVAAVILLVNNMLASFVLAFVTAYLLAPFVNALERTGIPRTLAILIPFSLLAILSALGIYLVVPLITAQFATLKSQLPIYIDGTTALLQQAQVHVHSIFPFIKMDIAKNAENYLVGFTQSMFNDLPTLISKSLTTLMLAPFFAYFMLQDGRNFSRALLGMVPNNLFELALNLQHQINKQMGDFIRARLLEAAIVGLVVWLGLYIIGFPYGPILALFAALTNLIPYIGPIIGAVPAVIISLINHSSGLDLVLLTTVYFVAQLIDVVFVIPLVVAKIVDLHPVTVVIVIIVGAQLLGVLGMVISIPVASACKLIFNAVYHHIVDFRTTA